MALKGIAWAGYGRMEPLLYQPKPLRRITSRRKGDPYQSKVTCRSVVGLSMVWLWFDLIEWTRSVYSLSICGIILSSIAFKSLPIRDKNKTLECKYVPLDTFHIAGPASGSLVGFCPLTHISILMFCLRVTKCLVLEKGAIRWFTAPLSHNCVLNDI